MNTAVILAAGRGKRLQPLTRERSKGMLPILGQPMIERVMENLAEAGIENFLLVRASNDQELEEYFGKRSPFRERTRIMVQEEARGSADAMRRAAPYIEDDFLVSACDNLIEPAEIRRLIEEWERERPEALLTLMPAPEDVSSSGIVAMEGPFVRRLVEKPDPEEAPSNLASLPLYALRPGVLALLPETPLSPRGEYELPGTIQLLIERWGVVRGFRVSGRMTLTRPADLLAINIVYLREKKPALKLEHEIPGVRLIQPVLIEPGASIDQGSIIGPEVYLEAGCRVGREAEIRSSVILRGAVVPDFARIENEVLSG